MPCNMETRRRAWKLRETVASENTSPHKKTKHACIVKAHESKRKRLESTLPRNHNGHIAGKGFDSGAQVHAAVDKEWQKLVKNGQHGNWLK